MKIFVQSNNDIIPDYQKAIKIAGKPLLAENLITNEFTKACIEREKDFPTGLQVNSDLGIAIPHGNQNFVNTSCVSFVRFSHPVKFGRMDDKSKDVKCSFIFNLALAKGDEHLTMLRTLMKLFQNKDFLQSVKNKKDKELEEYLYQKLN